MDNNANGFKEFVKAALRDPKNVSTIFPSLKFLAQALIRHADMAPGQDVLELGCGSGAITRHILNQRSQLASYTGVELDTSLVDFLRLSFPEELFLNISADDLSGHIKDESMDRVICSLPWTLFPSQLQESIVKEMFRVLRPGGKFTTFLCIHSLAYPGAPRARRIFKQHFTGFEKRETIARNIPPANVYLGTK